jgi:diaminohydroxyphosphoribosylaminopyrimidine deaminase/5-amino-6-(5-phosphoribosylamino)uracil reductase
VSALRQRVRVLEVAESGNRVDLVAALRELGARSVTSVLVEGGGEVLAAFLAAALAHRVAFFYAPLILGGRDSRRAVAGAGVGFLPAAPGLVNPRWRRVGPDLLLRGQLEYPVPAT